MPFCSFKLFGSVEYHLHVLLSRFDVGMQFFIPCIPTGPFPILETQNMATGELYEGQEIRVTDFKAP